MLTKEQLFEMLVSEFEAQNCWEALDDKHTAKALLLYLNGYAVALKDVSTQIGTETQQRG